MFIKKNTFPERTQRYPRSSGCRVEISWDDNEGGVDGVLFTGDVARRREYGCQVNEVYMHLIERCDFITSCPITNTLFFISIVYIPQSVYFNIGSFFLFTILHMFVNI